VNPPYGPIAGGTKLTIHGSGLAGALVVRLGDKTVTRFAVASDNAIKVTAPPSGPRTLDVTVTIPIGTTAIDPADRYS
jgi:hypothetical protein